MLLMMANFQKKTAMSVTRMRQEREMMMAMRLLLVFWEMEESMQMKTSRQMATMATMIMSANQSLSVSSF
jgi:hypothetical protein